MASTQPVAPNLLRQTCAHCEAKLAGGRFVPAGRAAGADLSCAFDGATIDCDESAVDDGRCNLPNSSRLSRRFRGQKNAWTTSAPGAEARRTIDATNSTEH